MAEPPPSMIDQAVRSRGIEDVGQCSGYCRVKTSNTNRWFAAIQIVSQMLGLVFVGVEAVGADLLAFGGRSASFAKRRSFSHAH